MDGDRRRKVGDVDGAGDAEFLVDGAEDLIAVEPVQLRACRDDFIDLGPGGRSQRGKVHVSEGFEPFLNLPGGPFFEVIEIIEIGHAGARGSG